MDQIAAKEFINWIKYSEYNRDVEVQLEPSIDLIVPDGKRFNTYNWVKINHKYVNMALQVSMTYNAAIISSPL